ncbi:MAG TPA: GntR family transcriptional regulator [Pseudonocardia sp.]
MVPNAPVRRSPADGRRLGAFVYDVVKERLLEGGWSAGESLDVESLKSDLGVSKQPVMDAFRRLAAEGLLEIVPQVGTRVPVFSMEDMSDFFAMFASLEAEATAVGARRQTPAQLAELVAINRQIAEIDTTSVGPSERVHGYLTANRRFHGVIQQMAHSDVVMRLSDRMWDMCDLMINTSANSRPLADEIGERHDDHERIIAALRDADVERARREMHAHIIRNVPMLERSRSTGD